MNNGGCINHDKLSQEDIECSTICRNCGKLIGIKIILEKPISYRERTFIMIEDHGSYFCNDCFKIFEKGINKKPKI